MAGVRLRSETSFRVLTVTDRASCSYCNQLMLKLTLNGAKWWSGNTMFNRGTEESLSNSNPPIWLPIHFHGEQYLMTLLLSTDIVKLNKNSFLSKAILKKRMLECALLFRPIISFLLDATLTHITECLSFNSAAVM